MGHLNAVTENSLRRFKKGDLLDVRTRLTWSGPHKLLVYKLDTPSKNQELAAYIEVELDQKRLKRWLIVGDQQVIRMHIPPKAKATIES